MLCSTPYVNRFTPSYWYVCEYCSVPEIVLPSAVVEEKVDIGYSAPGSKEILWSLKRGQPTRATFKQLCLAVAPKEFELHINLNLGKGSAVMYAAELTEHYVDFNNGDVSNPTTLGG